MASTAAQNYIGLNQLLTCGYSMIGIVSGFVLTRVGVRIVQPRPLAVEDILVALSYATFITSTALYVWIAPVIFKISDVISGQSPAYAEMERDALNLIKVFFANTMLFWITLWLVKGSLLSLYRKLVQSNRIYRRLWWAIVGFSVVTFIGAIVSHLTSCSSMHAWFTPGACATERDQHAQIISLYYAFAVDVLSDLFIMALPIGLIYNLQLSLARKAGIIALFCIGWLAIAAAVVRVVSIGTKAGGSTPSSSWLAFWGILETGLVVIIGCAPGLYSSGKQAYASRKESKYNASREGYQRHYGEASGASKGEVSKLSTVQVYATEAREEEQISPSTLLSHKKLRSFSRPIGTTGQRAVDLEMESSDGWKAAYSAHKKQYDEQ